MKKYTFGILAILLAVSLSAFSLKNEKQLTTFSQKYFTYTAYPSSTASNLNNSANYAMTTNNGGDPLICSGSGNRCGVFAQDDGTGHPVLSGAQIFQRQ